MVTALIKINGTAGSKDDLSLGLVTLTNSDNTGVLTWAWSLLSIPPGSSATISGATSATAAFTADVIGSYLIKLTVVGATGTSSNKEIAAIKTVNLGIRIPSAKETTEFGTTQGWAEAIYNGFTAIDDSYSYLENKYIPNMETLRTTISTIPNQFVILDGYYLAGDGGGGIFTWSNIIGPDNCGTIINPSGGIAAGWRRIYDGYDGLNVRWFGAKGDEITDDTNAIERALEAANGVPVGQWESITGSYFDMTNRLKLPVFFPSGRYRITRTIPIRINCVKIMGSNIKVFPGCGSRIIVDHSGTGIALDADYDPTYFMMQDIQMLKSDTYQYQGYGISMLGDNYTWGPFLKNVSVRFFDYGFYGVAENLPDGTGAGARFEVIECDFSINNKWGIYYIGHAGLSRFIDSSMSQNVIGGMFIGCVDSLIQGNNFEGQPYGLIIGNGTNSHNVIIQRNYFESNGGSNSQACIELYFTHNFEVIGNTTSAFVTVPTVFIQTCTSGYVDTYNVVLFDAFNIIIESSKSLLPTSPVAIGEGQTSIFAGWNNSQKALPISNTPNTYIIADMMTSTYIKVGNISYKAIPIKLRSLSLFAGPWAAGEIFSVAFAVQYPTDLPLECVVMILGYPGIQIIAAACHPSAADDISIGDIVTYTFSIKNNSLDGYSDTRVYIYPYGYAGSTSDAYVTDLITWTQVDDGNGVSLINPLDILNNTIIDTSYIKLNEATDPIAYANDGYLYVKDDSGDTELFYEDDSGNVVQITKDGYVSSTIIAKNMADLRTTIGLSKQVAILDGYYSIGDGGGGTFAWSNVVATDNNGTIVNPAGGTAAGWRRVYDGSINVKWFGAKGDGTTNDSTTLQKAFESNADGYLTLFFPPGTYIGHITPLSNTTILGYNAILKLPLSETVDEFTSVIDIGPYTLNVGSSIWVCMDYASDGLWNSTNAGSSFIKIISDASWNGSGYISGHNANRIVANVGKEVAPGTYYPIVEWDGNSWTVDTTITVSDIKAIPWCSENEIFLVHDSMTDRTWRRKNSGIWSIINTLSATNKYSNVHGASNSAVFACGSSSVPAHFVDRWNGSSVDRIYTSVANGYGLAVYALSTTSVWYAWSRESDGAIVIEHWDGASWTPKYATAHDGASPTAFWFADANNGWLVTDGWDVSGGPILYWNGATWIAQTLPAGVVQYDSFYSISGTSASDVYTVNIHGTDSHLLHYNGVSWSDITPIEWADLDPLGIVAFSSGSGNLVKNINIYGLTVDGLRNFGGPYISYPDAFRMGISIDYAQNILIKDVNIKNCYTDGILIGWNIQNNIILDNVISENNYRHGVSVLSGENIYISDSIFRNNGGYHPAYPGDYGAGIDIEDDSSSASDIDTIHILNCEFHNNINNGISIQSYFDHNISNVTIEESKFYDNGSSHYDIITYGNEYTLRNLYIINNNIEYTIYCSGTDGTIIENLYILDNYLGSSILCTGTDGTIYENGWINGNTVGTIQLDTADSYGGFKIEENIVRGNINPTSFSEVGISIAGFGLNVYDGYLPVSYSDAYGIVISKNTVIGGCYGISVGGTKCTIISENTLHHQRAANPGGGYAGGYGISVASSHHIIISNNVTDVDTRGINISGDYVSVIGNHITNSSGGPASGGAGLVVVANYTLIVNNILTNNSGPLSFGDYYISGTGILAWANILTSGQLNSIGSIILSGDIEITNSLYGVILKSPGGTRYRITVDNSGNLITTIVT